MQPRNGLWVSEFEAELLDIMAHWLNGRELQIDPSLVTADESLSTLLGNDVAALPLPEVVTACRRKSDSTNERCLGRGLLGGFGSVLSHALLTPWSENRSNRMAGREKFGPTWPTGRENLNTRWANIFNDNAMFDAIQVQSCWTERTKVVLTFN